MQAKKRKRVVLQPSFLRPLNEIEKPFRVFFFLRTVLHFLCFNTNTEYFFIIIIAFYYHSRLSQVGIHDIFSFVLYTFAYSNAEFLCINRPQVRGTALRFLRARNNPLSFIFPVGRGRRSTRAAKVAFDTSRLLLNTKTSHSSFA